MNITDLKPFLKNYHQVPGPGDFYLEKGVF
jgi:hypothetical protein